ncbi:glycosyltransferase [Peribacillus cavernae]|uniref:Glycosyltransferase n=1 Tax=Peribacillus cavernae TaxID=1674310 RepID=A0A3S0UB17_9BACI|nr:glycosyltransferase family 2 protein [Peribacillus cavernae]MDQ0220602.1 4,4'-diaponeurosporenoate glycosyltransferase [Peribacillus cavernae]RUQ27339.1 glycosyltransferase [Peribacillus cavernae]
MHIMLFLAIILTLVGLVSGTLMFWSLSRPKANEESTDIPYVSIIIPARNEANRLPHLLKSLNSQTWQTFEILVVDDASEDHTAAVATEYGATVLNNKEAVGGTTSGKSLACAYGAKHATGEWLLFLDADVKFVHKSSLKKLLSAYQEQHAKGILSVQPFHQMEKAYEQLSAVFNIIVLTGINVFTIWKQKFKTAGSFGPCILCDKESYLFSGGHELAKNSIMDDFALSENFTANKLPVRNFAGKGMITFRMYPEGMGQLIEGWTKTLATASQSTHWFVMLLINVWIAGALSVASLPVASIRRDNTVLIGISIVLYLLYGLHFLFLTRRVGNFSCWVVIFFPLLFIFFIALFMYSLYRTHISRSVMWKGRKIKM